MDVGGSEGEAKRLPSAKAHPLWDVVAAGIAWGGFVFGTDLQLRMFWSLGTAWALACGAVGAGLACGGPRGLLGAARTAASRGATAAGENGAGVWLAAAGGALLMGVFQVFLGSWEVDMRLAAPEEMGSGVATVIVGAILSQAAVAALCVLAARSARSTRAELAVGLVACALTFGPAVGASVASLGVVGMVLYATS